MTIREFHSRFHSADDKSSLVTALQRLRGFADVKSLVRAVSELDGDWTTWQDSGIVPRSRFV